MTHRVMHLIASLDWGGAERVVADLARRLDPSRYEPVVCYLQGEGALRSELERHGVEVVRLPDRARFDPRTAMAVAAVARARSINLLHLHIPRPAFWGSWGARLARVTHLVYTEHTIHEAYPLWLRVLLPTVVRRANAVVCVSEAARRSLQRRFPWAGAKLRTIHNGIDPDAERMQPRRTRLEVRAELQVAQHQPLLINLANLHPYKGHSDLLLALQEVRRQCPDARAVIVGSGALEAQLRAQAAALGLGDCVQLLGHRDDVADLLAASDLFVLSSLVEGLPISILEAMAQGLPCIVTDVGGCSELVQDGETGLVVPPREPQELAAAVVALLRDPSRVGQMGAASRQRVKERFSLRICAQRHERLYEELLHGG